MKLFIGCSSRDNIPRDYYTCCKELLDKLFENSYDLVFGACNKGLMGLAYKSAIKNNRDIVGIYPDAYIQEINEINCSLKSVKTVNDRTDAVIKESDVLIFLPGGIGTVYELFVSIESRRAGEHNKPIIIYDVLGFYNNLFLQLDKMYDEYFASMEDKSYYCVFNSASEVINYLNSLN